LPLLKALPGVIFSLANYALPITNWYYSAIPSLKYYPVVEPEVIYATLYEKNGKEMERHSLFFPQRRGSLATFGSFAAVE
jgi:hypothetical protein